MRQISPKKVTRFILEKIQRTDQEARNKYDLKTRSVTLLSQDAVSKTSQETSSQSRGWVIACTSFFFILLQSLCTAVMAVSGLRLLIGVGSLAAASTGIRIMDTIHGEAIRIPMMIVAIVGSVLNLYVIWRIRSLRGRSSSQWRAVPVTQAKKRAESMQIAIAAITLLLVAAEWVAHIRLFGSLFR
jgi:hypothetical protein